MTKKAENSKQAETQALNIPVVNNAKRTVCNCENVETTDIRLGEDGKYYHVLCKKPITN